MNDPSPRVKKTLPEPDASAVATKPINELIESITRLFGKTGMSADDAETVLSEPKRTNATDAELLVTTTDSPPPARGEAADTVVAATLTDPVGRNGLVDPKAMMSFPKPV